MATLYSFFPQTEDMLAPKTAPRNTATTGLHHRAQPPPPVAELIRYIPNPAAAPMINPISVFIIWLRPLKGIFIRIQRYSRTPRHRPAPRFSLDSQF